MALAALGFFIASQLAGLDKFPWQFWREAQAVLWPADEPKDAPLKLWGHSKINLNLFSTQVVGLCHVMTKRILRTSLFSRFPS